MANPIKRNYILGKGEVLTDEVPKPGGGGSGTSHPYTMPEAKRVLIPKMVAASESLDNLPAHKHAPMVKRSLF